MKDTVETGSDDIITPSTVSTFQMLNDDVIMLIFDSIEKFVDKVNFGCSDPRIGELFKRHVCCKFNVLNTAQIEELKLPNIIEFFRLAGPYIKGLQVSCESFSKESLIVEFITEYCKNLEKVDFMHANDDFHYKDILERMTSLKAVSIECMESDDVLNFDITKNVGLTSFTLINGCYTGSNLSSLPNLQRLSLHDCLIWNSSDFGISFRNLKTLELNDCSYVHMPVFQKLAENCFELEDLTFSCYETDYEVIAQLPKLKRLTLNIWFHTHVLQVSFVHALAKYKSEQLEFLKICGQIYINADHINQLIRLQALKELHLHNNDHLTGQYIKRFAEFKNLEALTLSFCNVVQNDPLVYLVSKLPKLRKLDVSYCCDVTDDVVLNIIHKGLRPLVRERDSRLVIKSIQSGIKKSIKQHPVVKGAKHLLQLEIFDLYIEAMHWE